MCLRGAEFRAQWSQSAENSVKCGRRMLSVSLIFSHFPLSLSLFVSLALVAHTCADSLEDQEGGAMYISCDVSNGGPVEPETGYVPNNPLFGLALDSPQVYSFPSRLFRLFAKVKQFLSSVRAARVCCILRRLLILPRQHRPAHLISHQQRL